MASIVLAHRDVESSWALAAARLQAGTPETALVWRRGFAPQVRVAAPGEAAFIAAVNDGRSLAEALRAAPDFDFAAWLAPAVHDQLLLGVIPS